MAGLLLGCGKLLHQPALAAGGVILVNDTFLRGLIQGAVGFALGLAVMWTTAHTFNIHEVARFEWVAFPAAAAAPCLHGFSSKLSSVRPSNAIASIRMDPGAARRRT